MTKVHEGEWLISSDNAKRAYEQTVETWREEQEESRKKLRKRRKELNKRGKAIDEEIKRAERDSRVFWVFMWLILIILFSGLGAAFYTALKFRGAV